MISKPGQSYKDLKKAEKAKTRDSSPTPVQAKDDTDHTSQEKIDIKTDPQTVPKLDAELGLETKEEGDKKAATRKKLDEKKIEKEDNQGQTLGSAIGYPGSAPTAPVAKAVSAGQSYKQLQKEDMQKGLGNDLLIGASLAATIAAAGSVHDNQKTKDSNATETKDVPAEQHVGQIYEQLDTKAKALKSKIDEVKAKRTQNGKPL